MSRSVLILKRDFQALGGAEKMGRALAHALHARGDRVTVLTTGPVSPSLPFETISMPQNPKTSWQTLRAFDRFAKKYHQALSPDITLGLDRNQVQTHLRAGSGVHRAYLNLRKQSEAAWKSVRHLINPLHRLLLQIEKTSFEHPALRTLFTNSHMVKKQILEHYRVDEHKIAVIHNGVEWHPWQPFFDAWPQSYQGRRFEFLFLGHNFERKGLVPLLQGLSLLPTREFHLSVVGHDKHLPRYERLASKLHLSQQVTFHGPQATITPFYQNADALVIPSYYDPFANVTVEALAMGLYVVSSKTNGGSEILTPETGTVIQDLTSAESVATALSQALQHPKTIESAIRRRQSVKHLDFSIQLSRYLERMQ